MQEMPLVILKGKHVTGNTNCHGYEILVDAR